MGATVVFNSNVRKKLEKFNTTVVERLQRAPVLHRFNKEDLLIAAHNLLIEFIRGEEETDDALYALAADIAGLAFTLVYCEVEF